MAAGSNFAFKIAAKPLAAGRDMVILVTAYSVEPGVCTYFS